MVISVHAGADANRHRMRPHRRRHTQSMLLLASASHRDTPEDIRHRLLERVTHLKNENHLPKIGSAKAAMSALSQLERHSDDRSGEEEEDEENGETSPEGWSKSDTEYEAVVSRRRWWLRLPIVMVVIFVVFVIATVVWWYRRRNSRR